MSFLRLFLFVSILSYLAACGGAAYSKLYKLIPVTTQDESKRFHYGFAVPDHEGVILSKENHRSPSFERMRKELKKYMAANPYCLEGYFVYDETFDGQSYVLHGECQESK